PRSDRRTFDLPDAGRCRGPRPRIARPAELPLVGDRSREPDVAQMDVAQLGEARRRRERAIPLRASGGHQGLRTVRLARGAVPIVLVRGEAPEPPDADGVA